MGENNKVKAPWHKSMGELPAHLNYFQGSMFEAVEQIAEKHPKNTAFDFMGSSTTYEMLIRRIIACARALRALGVKPGDRITIAMPNCPQAVCLFYAVGVVGGIANMIHPLSAQKEIEFYLNTAESGIIFTLDQFYDKIAAVRANTPVKHVILARISDELSLPLKIGYALTDGRKIPKIPLDAPIINWQDFIALGRSYTGDYRVKCSPDDPAVILYSGGTTGMTKGILLSHMNFNALAAQIAAANPMFRIGDRMLAAMPLFHGFGLGVCIHAMLANGGCCVLVPRFTAKTYGRLITKKRCNFIAGVPTLFEALLRLKDMDGADLSSLKGVFSGGDSLSVELKKRFDRFLAEHKAVITIREGYGTTECVTASCLTPPHLAKEGSIGIPFPDMFFKIVEPGTARELPYGEEGEILISGPTVMKGYLNNPDETAKTLRAHDDGLVWVYTGDLGCMDEDGFIFFRGRIKRMIVSSGYNIYPAQLENILDAHEYVRMSCVIGLPDPYKIQKVKAFIVLRDGVPADTGTKEALMAYCRKNIAKYALPYEIELRASLPTTLVGKVAYRLLEEEEAEKG